MKGYQIVDEEALLTALKSGDIAAFEEIYKRYWFNLYSIAYKQVDSKQDAEELVQTIFERIWKNRQTVAIKNIGAYLTISLRNVLIDFLRKKSTETKFQNNYNFLLEANLTEEEVNRVQLLNTIENLLQELPSKTRTIFKMSRYDDKSVKEIAAELELTDKAVEYHITQSIKHLKQYLKNYLSFFF